MTADTPGDGAVAEAEPERQLFRVGSLEQRLQAVVHSLALVLTAFLVAGLLSGVTTAGIEAFGITEDAAPVAWSLFPMGAHFVGFFVVAVAYVEWADCRSLVSAAVPSLRDVLLIVIGFVVLVGSLNGLEALFSQFGFEPADNSAVVAGEGNPELYLYIIPVVILLNAPAEELLFRGLVQGRFRQAYGVVPGIVLAAGVFGLVHYVALVGTGSELVYVSIAAAAGLVLGAAYEYTGNLAVPIAIHACWNVATYLLLYADATGGF